MAVKKGSLAEEREGNVFSWDDKEGLGGVGGIRKIPMSILKGGTKMGMAGSRPLRVSRECEGKGRQRGFLCLFSRRRGPSPVGEKRRKPVCGFGRGGSGKGGQGQEGKRLTRLLITKGS